MSGARAFTGTMLRHLGLHSSGEVLICSVLSGAAQYPLGEGNLQQTGFSNIFRLSHHLSHVPTSSNFLLPAPSMRY